MGRACPEGRAREDERGRSILDPSHAEARSEQCLAARLEEGLRNLVVDRTFVEDGVRWIIDYKTGSHGGGELRRFAESERNAAGSSSRPARGSPAPTGTIGAALVPNQS